MEKNKDQNQYSSAAVPQSERKSFFSVFSVVAGYVLIITSINVGVEMGKVSDLKTILAAIFVGSLVILAIGVFMALIAAKNGMTFAMMTQYAFGKTGSTIIASLIALTLVCWFSVDAALIAQATVALFKGVPFWLILVIAAVAMTLTAMFGMKYMGILGTISIPLVLIIGTWSMIKSVTGVGGLGALFAIKPAESLPFVTLVALVVGSWIGSAHTLLADILRFAQSSKHAVTVAAIAIMVGNP